MKTLKLPAKSPSRTWSPAAGVNRIFRSLGISEQSIATYSNFIRQYLDHLRTTAQPENEASVRSFIAGLQGSPSTINLAINALRRYLGAKYAGDIKMQIGLEQLFRSPEIKKRKTRIEKRVLDNDYLTREQVFVLAEGCRETQPILSLILRALFWTGARISELLSITHEKAYLEASNPEFRIIGKGRKERTVYMPSELYREIVEAIHPQTHLFESRNHNPLHRVNISKGIRTVGKRAGLNIHAHTLRHSCAMYLKDERGLSADKIAKYLGHSSPAITLEYYFHGAATAEEIGVESAQQTVTFL